MHQLFDAFRLRSLSSFVGSSAALARIARAVLSSGSSLRRRRRVGSNVQGRRAVIFERILLAAAGLDEDYLDDGIQMSVNRYRRGHEVVPDLLLAGTFARGGS